MKQLGCLCRARRPRPRDGRRAPSCSTACDRHGGGVGCDVADGGGTAALRAISTRLPRTRGRSLARHLSINCASCGPFERGRRHSPRCDDHAGLDCRAGDAVDRGDFAERSSGVREAIVAGYEAMIRLGLALDGPTILYRGIWPSYLAAPFGMAAAAARLLDLSADQTAHALALALTLAAPGVGHHNAPTGSRWFAIGGAARNGWLAAQAARAGFTSDVNLLDGSFFGNVFGITPKPAALIEGLGANSCCRKSRSSPGVRRARPWRRRRRSRNPRRWCRSRRHHGNRGRLPAAIPR